MKMLVAWVTLVLAGILAFGFLLVLIDLVSTKIANGSAYVYADMAIALILLSGAASVASRTFRRIRLRPHH
jgi:hypothetical protein